VVPNAGLPDEDGHYHEGPDVFCDVLGRFLENGWLNLVGGCCGTTAAHVTALADLVQHYRPRDPAHHQHHRSVVSGLEAVELTADNRPLFVGERTNVLGSRKFKRLIQAGDYEAAAEVGRAQVRAAAQVIDVCLQDPDRDEVADMEAFLDKITRLVKVPLMIDSTDAEVMECALTWCQGKGILNSINLEDGLERCEKVLPLVKEHGAAVICLTIDEAGMAKTAEDKLRIARRLYDVCTRDYGIRPEDLLFDVLTFTICTGNEDDRKLGLETLEGIRRVRAELPGVGTLLGLSNISFGLRPAARHALNSVYLHHAQAAGMTAAILHAGRIEPLHHVDDEVRQTCEDLIFDRRREGYDPLQKLMALFENVDPKAKKEREIPTDVFERLKWRIVEGERPGLAEDLDEAMRTKAPLEIINVDLLAGMAVVGDLFGRGEMQLPFVLQSAETMKAAVAHLEPFMTRVDGQTRGKVLLATVRGDVHDIGKNLVDIILTNNGYTVYNIGIKQPIEHILEVANEHKPHAIGLSGLLVKSTVVMRENLEEMNRREIATPVILGGAALTRAYVEDDCRRVYHGPLYYAKDAFEGLDVIGRVMSGAARPEPVAKKTKTRDERAIESVQRSLAAVGAAGPTNGRPAPDVLEPVLARAEIPRDIAYPAPPFLGPRLVEAVNLQSVLPFINETTLFHFQWGYRRKGRSTAEHREFVDKHVRPLYHDLARRCAQESIVEPKAAYGFWRCVPDGDALVLLHPEDDAREVARFAFPRQAGKKHLCISDFFHRRGDEPDVVALQVVTIGQRASDVAREWFAADRYQDYLHLHGFGVEAAEGLAEMIHKQIRAELGIAGDDARDMARIFKQGYRGSRFSFGYPACPHLADQEVLLDLLGADRIGIQLGEEDQLWPEQSTSALVCHHPNAKYFTI
jgi:5-methyltetrahydrofolate--homocysteine methyltransferase